MRITNGEARLELAFNTQSGGRHTARACYLLLTALLLAGCSKGPTTKMIYGSVTCGGEKVAIGRVSFVPIDGAEGRICVAPIADGQYRTESLGGVRLGKYRVEIDARRKTGRKIQGSNGVEQAMIDEEVRLGPAAYSGDKSPLMVEITSDFKGQYDIVMPVQ